MDVQKAKDFIRKNARAVELAEYNCLFENGPKAAFVEALKPYQNPDGGFGHALEPDNWNPGSSPITTNDAMGRLFEAGALEEAGEMAQGMVRYLTSGRDFDQERRRWLFAIDSNKDYPHAVWWEKKPEDVPGWNPSVSLAAFLVYMGAPGPWREMVTEAFQDLERTEEKSGDEAKCYMLAWKLLESAHIAGVIDFEEARKAVQKALEQTVCPDAAKYGVEYVPSPSWFFQEECPFLYEGAKPLIQAERAALARLQMEDGGFDITWQWYTPYGEFEQARAWWRPRATLEKLRFFVNSGC